MGYSRLFKSRRISAGLTQKEVSKKLRCSIMTVSTAERPYGITKQLPSEEYIKKFVHYFGTSESDQIELERNLMIERALIYLPPIVAEQFRESLTNRRTVNRGAMPLPFRKLLATDWRKCSNPKKQDHQYIEAVIDGERLISRDDVIALAKCLHGDTDKYLLASQYLTDGMIAFINLSGRGTLVLDHMIDLPREDFDFFINSFLYVLEQYKRIHGPKRGRLTQ